MIPNEMILNETTLRRLATDGKQWAVEALRDLEELKRQEAAEAIEREQQATAAEARRLAAEPKSLPLRVEPNEGDYLVLSSGEFRHDTVIVPLDGSRYFLPTPVYGTSDFWEWPRYVSAAAGKGIAKARFAVVIPLSKVPDMADIFAARTFSGGIVRATEASVLQDLRAFAKSCKSVLTLLGIFATAVAGGKTEHAGVIRARLEMLGVDPLRPLPVSQIALLRELWPELDVSMFVTTREEGDAPDAA
jgi:hypothetical protein